MKKKLTMESNFTLIFMWKQVTFRSFLSLCTNSQSPTSRLPVDFYLLFRPDERQQSTLTHSPNTHFTSITLSSLINEHRFYPIWLLLWIKLCTVSLCIASQSRVPFPLIFHFLKRKVPCPRSHPISSCAIITEILFFPPCRCHDGFYFPFRVSAEDPVAALHEKPLWSWETDTEARQTTPMSPFPLFLPAARSNSGGTCSSNHSAAASTMQLGRSPR